MRPLFYILDGQTPVVCYDIKQWRKAFSNLDRRVARDDIDDIRISTVFLSLDYNFSLDGPPLLFETMVFVGDDSEYCERYPTWDAAAAGHKRIVDAIRHQEESAGDHATALFANLRALRRT